MATSTTPISNSQPINKAVEEAWLKFVKSLNELLGPIPKDRPMDQYLDFRNKVIEYVQSEKFIREFITTWHNQFIEHKDEGELLLSEIKAFPLAIEIGQITEKKKKGRWQRFKEKWLGKGSTVVGSVKDLLDGLPPFAKMGLTALKELLDLFKGK